GGTGGAPYVAEAASAIRFHLPLHGGRRCAAGGRAEGDAGGPVAHRLVARIQRDAWGRAVGNGVVSAGRSEVRVAGNVGGYARGDADVYRPGVGRGGDGHFKRYGLAGHVPACCTRGAAD